MEIYGTAVADKLDNSRGILNKRFYRQVGSAESLTYLKGDTLPPVGFEKCLPKFTHFARIKYEYRQN